MPSYVFGFAVGPFRRVVESHRGVRLEYLGASFTDAELRQVFELAHQWWGNSVTCRDWNHFWLNEGMATFLADAYLERRFGAEAYARQIAG
ncbi:MAG TPA: M1 family aminopeptidase, partial [Vicinamibacteria bacterium]|nr:M1 family aminopeptidase [Vicinamibacteria bacterium]